MRMAARCEAVLPLVVVAEQGSKEGVSWGAIMELCGC